MDKTFIAWLLTLGIGFPILFITLGELASILERQKHPLAIAIRKIREYALPPLVILLVMRSLLKIAKTEDSARLVESITLVAAILALVSLLNAILTTKKPDKLQIKVPNLFFQIARMLVILGIGYYLVTGVWGVDLAGLATALGVGSLVIALALQDTLSNLVSGLLLLIARPFKVGDWIDFDGVEARVVDQNWWAVTLKTPFFERTVPNGKLSQSSITNYGQSAVWKKISLGFSYDDSPNKVLAALSILPDGIEAITKGSAFPIISSYGGSSINYELWYKAIPDQGAWGAGGKLLARAYYMAQREGFTIPYPMEMQYAIDANQGIPSKIPQIAENRQSEMITYLRSLPYFFNLNDTQIEQLATKSQFKVYGAGELITQAGKPDEGLYAIYTGRVKSSVKDNRGLIQTANQFGIGDVFGEMAIYPGEVSPITALAEDDVEAVVIPAAEIIELIQINPKFASEIIQFIEKRKKSLRLAQGVINSNSFTDKDRQKVTIGNS